MDESSGFSSLSGGLRLSAENLSLPMFAERVKVVCKRVNFIQISQSVHGMQARYNFFPFAQARMILTLSYLFQAWKVQENPS